MRLALSCCVTSDCRVFFARVIGDQRVTDPTQALYGTSMFSRFTMILYDEHSLLLGQSFEQLYEGSGNYTHTCHTHALHMRAGSARSLEKGFSTASMVSDGHGPVDMQAVGEVGSDGKTRRAAASTSPNILVIEPLKPPF